MRNASLRRAAAVVAGLTLVVGVVSATTASAATKPKPKAKPAVSKAMAKLIKAAKKEGQLNVIALPHDWANYGEIITSFAKKYGIKVNEQNPDGSSADEINAVISLRGQQRQPDVVDVGLQFAVQGAEQGLFQPYKVSTWKDLPATAKDPAGKWFLDYGGFIAIGYNAKLVSPAPTSIKDLLNPAYKNQVALNGDPTQAGAAFAGVFAAALSNGGSVTNIQPGLDFFSKLKAAGNYIPVQATPATVQSGQTPITLDWDYLQAKYKDETSGKVDWKVVVPSDAQYGGFYAQAIVKHSPHPNAAKLWEEYLYSNQGQNLWLKGGARPIRLDAMVKAGTANKTYLSALPAMPAKSKPTFASLVDILLAKVTLASGWSKI